MLVEPTADEPLSLSDSLVAELQRRILGGQIAVGSWLRHEALAEEFGVSRTPVREALRVLQAQGIVTIVKNRGALVDGLSGRDIRELGEVRAELEGLAAALAAENMPDDLLVVVNTAWDAFESALDAGDTDRAALEGTWREANRRFHSAILNGCGNRQLGITITEVSRRLPTNSSFAIYARSSRLLRENLEQHHDIVRAIEAHDARKARAAMSWHIRSTAEHLARWVEDQDRG
ncbi:GntR family transcriptional regulator [Gordonia terrae]|uniref:GntR family transcriptional regulator n=1 Tax=Gordonia terrae TaxID=2055 RepID=UPI000ADB67E5|nr:GntR family transcriptional regulator [Gordonia terrae]VTR08545.1 transcriptional regulator, GntR family [Clostridioides difficile]VTS64028.1 HTH-type transcriptional regulator mcbR [Gordonia terrae]